MVRIEISNCLKITGAAQETVARLKNEYTVANPDYYKLERLGKWTGGTPQTLAIWQRDGDTLILPSGTLQGVLNIMRECGEHGAVKRRFKPPESVFYKSNISLYQYQENAVEAAQKAESGIIVAPCGSGKTQMGLELIARLGVKTLWLTHTHDLLAQSMERAKSCYDLDYKEYGTITAGKVDIGSAITFATVQTMAKLNLEELREVWDCVVVDECFPKSTLIDMFDGKKPIQDLQVGDMVASWNEAEQKFEYKPILRTFRTKAHDIVTVKLENGQEINCTANHPFFTAVSGWKKANELGANDYVMQYLPKRNRFFGDAKINVLQDKGERIWILLQRMFQNRASKTKCLDRETARNCVKNNGRNKQKVCKCKDENKQSDEKARSTRGSITKAKGDGASAGHKRWKWNWPNIATASNGFCASKLWPKRFDRISDSDKNAKRFWLSNLLQGRYWTSGFFGSDRNRWEQSLRGGKKRTRREKRQLFVWPRVESITYQERTSDGRFGGLCPDGFVYNIEVADNNNYFADGILVHNCHHVAGSPTKLMQFGKVVNALSARYKYGLSATLQRADGLIKCTKAYLGDVVFEVSQDAVRDTTCPVKYEFVDTGWDCDVDDVTNSDGTLNYVSLINAVCDDAERNKTIALTVYGELEDEPKNRVLILTERVLHAGAIYKELQKFGIKAVTVTGSTKKDLRETAISLLKSGEYQVMIATYQLAKEGLDIPELTHLILASPNKTDTVIIQAAGRVARKSAGKEFGTIIDFNDSFLTLQSWAKKRERIYKKLGYSHA